MSDSERDREPDHDVRFDNWPIERYDEYEAWDVERETPGEEGTREELAEEYSNEVDDEEFEWIGFVGAPGTGTGYFYAPGSSTIHEGDLDDEEERVILREASHEEVEEESIGEHIEEIGDEHGWSWLSSFAREHLEDDDGEGASFELRDEEFEQRNVARSDPYDLAFYGSYTFDDVTGRVHILERFYNVYLDDEERVSNVEVEEKYLLADQPREEHSEGDATIVDENTREIDVHEDMEEFGAKGELEAKLERWHEEHIGWEREE